MPGLYWLLLDGILSMLPASTVIFIIYRFLYRNIPNDWVGYAVVFMAIIALAHLGYWITWYIKACQVIRRHPIQASAVIQSPSTIVIHGYGDPQEVELVFISPALFLPKGTELPGEIFSTRIPDHPVIIRVSGCYLCSRKKVKHYLNLPPLPSNLFYAGNQGQPASLNGNIEETQELLAVQQHTVNSFSIVIRLVAAGFVLAGLIIGIREGLLSGYWQLLIDFPGILIGCGVFVWFGSRPIKRRFSALFRAGELLHTVPAQTMHMQKVKAPDEKEDRIVSLSNGEQMLQMKVISPLETEDIARLEDHDVMVYASPEQDNTVLVVGEQVVIVGIRMPIEICDPA